MIEVPPALGGLFVGRNSIPLPVIDFHSARDPGRPNHKARGLNLVVGEEPSLLPLKTHAAPVVLAVLSVHVGPASRGHTPWTCPVARVLLDLAALKWTYGWTC